MKPIFPLILCLILFWSCKQEKSTNEPDKEFSEQKSTITGDENSGSIQQEILKTSTGKTITLIIEQKSSSISDFKIIAKDFSNTQDTLIIKDADPLQHTWIKDLDQNGYDELYLITNSSGSGSYATIHGFASNKDLSLTPIYVPDISENDLLPEGKFFGYMGHDSIYFNDNRLYRKFPIYKEDDANCCPTGGDKILRYHLKAGEASWKLELEN